MMPSNSGLVLVYLCTMTEVKIASQYRLLYTVDLYTIVVHLVLFVRLAKVPDRCQITDWRHGSHKGKISDTDDTHGISQNI